MTRSVANSKKLNVRGRPKGVRAPRRLARKWRARSVRGSWFTHVQPYQAHPIRLRSVVAAMDAYEPTAVTSLIPAQDSLTHRLELLTLEEAHDLLRLLQLIAAEGEEELSREAEWFAREITARIPSEN
ncbi:DUF6417 family protein [Streptomyces sp. SGAir0957]